MVEIISNSPPNVAAFRAVSDSESLQKFTNFAGHFAPGQYKGFDKAELEEALLWAGSDMP